MGESSKPGWFTTIEARHPAFIGAVNELGEAVRAEGPLDDKSAHLVQLAAAAAMRSEGAVHSHVRRAFEAGASREEIEHALMLVTSTIGFPNVAAALRWAEDVFEKRQ